MWGHLFVAVVDPEFRAHDVLVRGCRDSSPRSHRYEKSMNEFDGIFASKGNYLDLYPVLYHTAYVSMYLNH